MRLDRLPLGQWFPPSPVPRMSYPARSLRSAAFAVVSAVVLSVSCSDSRDASLISGPRSMTRLEAEKPLSDQIDELTASLFLSGHRTSVQARWANVKRQSMKNASGRAQHASLMQWIEQHTTSIAPPAGETQQHAATRLVLLMSTYVYEGPDATPPEISAETDATVEIILPTETDTAVTPARHAGVIFPAGAVSEPTVIVVSENTDPFPAECSGPLPTSRCQYPLFYKFSAFPNVRLNLPVRIAVCHVNTGDRRVPLADHDRFRLAHEAPPDPSAFHPEGVREEGIEILPLVSVGPLLTCEDTHAHDHAAADAPRGTFASLMWSVRSHASRIVAAAASVFAPKTLYAIDRGGGGEAFRFSNFATVDPESRADVAPSTTFTLSSSSVAVGGSLTINAWSIENLGTAAAPGVTPTVVLARDSAMTQELQTLATLPTRAIAPLQPVAVEPLDVAMPGSLTPGTWFVGVRLVSSGVNAESDLTNNHVSARVTVGDPTVLFCPDGPEGSFGDMQAAIDAAPSNGTVLICDGEHRFDNATVSKPLTIRSQNRAGSTVGNLSEGSEGQSGVPAFVVDGVTSGLVRFVDLHFSIQGRGIHALNAYDQIVVDSSRFTGRGSTFVIGIMNRESSVSGARVEITNSIFSNLGLGVFPVGAVETNVRRSTFDTHSGGSIVYSFQGAFEGRPASYSFGTVEDNVFRNCAQVGCVRHLTAGQVVIARNRFEGGPRPINVFLGVIRLTATTTDPRLPAIIEDNVIVGTAGSSPTSTDWPFPIGIAIGETQPVQHIIRRNQITNAQSAISLSGSALVTDNVIQGGNIAISHASGSVVARNNDVVGTAGSFTSSPNALSDLRCNYWGSPSGPTNPVGGAQFTPWATQPVAGTGADCDPTIPATVRVCTTSGDNVPTYASASVAYSQVAMNGTVLFCDGTHLVQNVDVRKSATFAAEAPGMPTLNANGALSVFRSFNQPADIVIRGLRLIGATEHTIHVNSINSLLVQNSRIEPHQTFPYNPDQSQYQEGYMSGVGVFGRVGAVTVENSTFAGGDIGVHVNVGCCTQDGAPGSADVTVRNSTFTGQSNAGVFTGGGSENYVLRVLDNSFQDCGRLGCTRAFTANGGSLEYEGNRFTATMTRPTLFALQMDMVPGGTARVDANVVTGAWNGQDRTQPSSFAFGSFIWFAGTSVGASRNSAGGVFQVFTLARPGAALTGSDNQISGVSILVAGGSQNSAQLQRNDISDYVRPLSPAAFAGANIRCNWWGSSEGPTGTDGVTPTAYTPWATQPIANTNVACDPNATTPSISIRNDYSGAITLDPGGLLAAGESISLSSSVPLTVSVWDCGEVGGCRWAPYTLQPGRAYHVITDPAGPAANLTIVEMP